MKTNIEIEFKTAISKETYQELLKKFNLEDNIFKQTNYYFDTKDNDLSNSKIVLRIRKKCDSYCKITLKSQKEHEAFEKHILLTEPQVKDMLENGFKTKDFFDDIDFTVTHKATLDNFRVSTPYLDGTLFLDRCDYYGKTDYEVEYEVDNFQTGKANFDNFLKSNKIEYVQTKRKSERAFGCLEK